MPHPLWIAGERSGGDCHEHGGRLSRGRACRGRALPRGGNHPRRKQRACSAICVNSGPRVRPQCGGGGPFAQRPGWRNPFGLTALRVPAPGDSVQAWASPANSAEKAVSQKGMGRRASADLLRFRRGALHALHVLLCHLVRRLARSFAGISFLPPPHPLLFPFCWR